MKTNKRLLMISYPFPPNASAGAVRSLKFAKYLPDFGWETDVITIHPRVDAVTNWASTDQESRRFNVFRTKTIDPWLFFSRRNYQFVIFRLFRSLMMRLFSFPDHMGLWIPFAVRRALAQIHKQKYDAIYTTSPPHSSHIAGLIISRMSNLPWIADFRDPWTQNAYRRNDFMERFLFHIEKLLEVSVYKNATVILANTESNRRRIMHDFAWLSKDKVVLLPNGWIEFASNKMKKPQAKKFEILHAGSFYPKFQPYGLLKAIAAWRKGEIASAVGGFPENKVSIRLLGVKDEVTRNIVKNLELEDIVTIEGWVPLNSAREFMCGADLLWATLGTGNESSSYVPSKLFEYFAAKRPIIGFFPEGDAAELITKTGTGTVFSSDAPEPIAYFLKNAINDKEKDNIAYHPNELNLQAYHIHSIVKRLSGILDSICPGAPLG